MTNQTPSKTKATVARVIRIVSIPPIMVAALIILLATLRTDVFFHAGEVCLALFFLALFPVLSYPFCFAIPKLRKKGRELQRNVAFVFTGIAYTAGFVYARIAGISVHQKFIFTVYFFSFLLLLLATLTKIKSSAHACSCVGPIVLCACYLGLIAIFIGVLFYIVIFWASVVSKRHTVLQFILGTLTAFITITVAYFIYHPIF